MIDVGDLVLVDTQGQYPDWDGLNEVTAVRSSGMITVNHPTEGVPGMLRPNEYRELPELPDGLVYTGEQRRPRGGEQFISLMSAKDGVARVITASSNGRAYREDNLIVAPPVTVEICYDEDVDEFGGPEAPPLVQVDEVIYIGGHAYDRFEAQQILRELDEALS